MSDLRELYRDIILDHGKGPRNFRVITDAERSAEGYNPLCGDRITVYLRMDDGSIAEATFDGAACAICMASASMMTQAVTGLSEAGTRGLFDEFRGMLIDDVAVDEAKLGQLAALMGVRKYPMRVKCATLPWHTMKSALDQRRDVSTTE